MSARPETWLGIFLIALTCAIGLGIWVVKSRFEASAYNRITGSHVSTWDAMWVELRVQDSPRLFVAPEHER